MINVPGSFQPVANLMFDNTAKLALKLEEVAGFATLSFGPLTMGGSTPTGLANDATLYYVKHQVDAAGSATEVSFAGSTAQTFTALVAALQAAIGVGVVVTLVGGDIVITSVTTGLTSKVVITAGTTGADLLTSVRSGQSVYLKTNVSEKGHVKYLRWDQLDAMEQAEMRTIMNTLDAGDTEWTFATAGLSISTDVAGTLSPFDAMLVAAGVYTLNVTVDGTLKTVSFDVDAGATIDNAFESFAAAMRVAFPAAEVAQTQADVDTINWMVTSPTAGVAGGVTVAAGGSGVDFLATVDATTRVTAVIAEVDGVDGVAGALADGTPIAATAGKAYVTSDVAVAAGDTAILLASAGTYYFNVAVDGAAAVEYNITTAADTSYTALAALLDAATGLDAAGVDVTFDDAADRFVFTRKTTGASTSVVVTAGTTGTDVFAQVVTDGTPTTMTPSAVAGTDAIADASIISVLAGTKAPNGFPVLTSVGPTAIFEREDRPQMRYLPRGDGTYYNGSAWVVWPA